jgi:glyoxylase-like metal-dependent hydrolase (beta-lactamase superfamily II)
MEMSQPWLSEDETAIRHVERLGYAAQDVRHIILTHLDIDHSGGLPDFPDAQVHVLQAEIDAAFAAAPSFRYRPGHWAHGPKWVSYVPESNDTWFGFTALEAQGLADDILLVPLGGHTAGHTGVAVPADDNKWLLHCGDAYYYHSGPPPVSKPTQAQK